MTANFWKGYEPEPVQDTDAHYKGVVEGVQKLFDDKRAQRPWVGLTADEILDALLSVDPETKRLPTGFGRFACAIEAKLKERNQ